MAYNIPNVAGVPALNFSAGFVSGLDLLVSDAINYFSAQFGPQWGIFQGGSPVVTADAVASFEYRQEWSVSDYPVEQGGFESFNKVSLPYDVRVRYIAGGDESNKAALLASIDAIAGDLNFYDVVSPTATYTSCNVMHYNYKRTAANGVGLLQVDVWLNQINVQAQSESVDVPPPGAGSGPGRSPSGPGVVTGLDGNTPTYAPVAASPSSPAASPPVNGGTVNAIVGRSN